MDFHLFVGPTGHIPSKKLFFQSLPETQLQFGQVGRFDTVPSKVITYHKSDTFTQKVSPYLPECIIQSHLGNISPNLIIYHKNGHILTFVMNDGSRI